MNRHLLFAAALLALAACGKEGPEYSEDGAPVEIRLTGSLEAQTRSTHGLDTQIAPGEIVHVWVDDAVTGGTLYADNSLTADGSGGFSGGATMYFPSSGNAVDIYAVHGSLSSTTSFWGQSMTHTVASDQQSGGTGYAASDLVYCKSANVARTNDAVNLTFGHLLSKIEVVLKQGDGSPEISKAAILNTQLTASFTPAKANDGITVTASGSAGDIAIDYDVTTDTEVLNEAVIVPQTIASGTRLIRIIAAEDVELYYTTAAETVFEAGKKYRYVITVSLTGLSVAASVSDWTSEADEAVTVNMGYAYTTDSDGTRNYIVRDEAGLRAWAEYTRAGNWSTNCTLANDIELKSNWTAVGHDHYPYTSRYTGTFDGSGHTIENLTINVSGDYQGLIGCLGSGGAVKNLTLEEVSISASSFVGAVAGTSLGTVSDCTVSGTVSSYDYTGGVVGGNYGTVTSCHSTAEVTGNGDHTGGVVGVNGSAGTVTACCSTGNVEGGDDNTGGVVGRNYGAVTACYSTSTVYGADEEVGGVVGQNRGGTVTACYFAGSVSGGDDDIGGVVGINEDGGSATGCYWTNGITGGGAATSGIGDPESNDGAAKVENDVTWESAAEAMNAKLTENSVAWEYVYNGADADPPLSLEPKTE